MLNLNYDTNELIYKTETDSETENKSMFTKEERRRQGYIRSMALGETDYTENR